jgi:hypothetical protein
MPPGATGFVGWNRDGVNLWSLETRAGDNDGGQWLEGYDAENKTSRFILRYSDLGLVGSFNAPIVGVGKCAFFGNRARIQEVDTAGNITDWTVNPIQAPFPLPPRSLPLDFGSNSWAIMPAQLNWPTFAGVNSSSLFVCDIGQPVAPSTFCHATNIRNVSAHSGSTWEPNGFDAFDTTWAAVTRYNSGSQRLQFLINGSLIWDLPAPTNPGYPGAIIPHVCFPHETLGAGYVAIGDYDAAQNGYLSIYKNGVRVWRSNPINTISPPLVYGSTDRWVYFTTYDSVNVNTFTNGKFHSVFGDGAGGGAGDWIVKHDGSELMPIGAVLDTKTIIHPYSTMSAAGGPPLTRDSSKVPYCLAGSYEEMYDQRNDTF